MRARTTMLFLASRVECFISEFLTQTVDAGLPNIETILFEISEIWLKNGKERDEK
jgi:hypothetical protein